MFTVIRADVKQAQLGTDVGLQRHDDAFAQRIDRGIRNLRKLLPEIIERRADFFRQHRHRCVVTHRADRLHLGLGEHGDNLAQLLARQVEHLLIAGENIRLHRLGRRRRIDQLRVQVANTFLQPFLVRRTRFQNVVDLIVVEQHAVDEIDGEHFARTQAALADHILVVVVVDADLRCDRDVPVFCQHIACGTQAVAIETAGRVATVGQHDAGRPVPRLELTIVELVESTHVGVDIVNGLPGRRHQYAHRLDNVHAAGAQHLEHVVERRRVRPGHRDDRIEIGHIGQLFRTEILAAGNGPVTVALYRVDLAIVREETKRLRQPPLR